MNFECVVSLLIIFRQLYDVEGVTNMTLAPVEGVKSDTLNCIRSRNKKKIVKSTWKNIVCSNESTLKGSSQEPFIAFQLALFDEYVVL
jgi:hypothetical protein